MNTTGRPSRKKLKPRKIHDRTSGAAAAARKETAGRRRAKATRPVSQS